MLLITVVALAFLFDFLPGLKALLEPFLPGFHFSRVGLPGSERLRGHELGCGDRIAAWRRRHGAGRFDQPNGSRNRYGSGWVDLRRRRRFLGRKREGAKEGQKKQTG